MNGFNSKSLAIALVLFAGGLTSALAGGFGVAVFLPKQDDARMKDALLMVQPIGCHGPGASVMARAEGIVNGKRQSVPVKLVPITGENDTYIVRREWPSDGTWVLLFTAKKDYEVHGKTQSLFAHALVQMDRNGKVLLVDRPKNHNWDSAKVLSDGKTKLLPWTFDSAEKVVAMSLVAGDLKTAISYAIKSSAIHQ